MSADGPTPQPSGPSRFWPWAVLVAAFAFHAVQAVRLFPSWGALVDDERPVVMADHAIHLYHGAIGARFVREHGTTWGYDPFFMAGYPETPVWDSSSNLSIAFQFLAGGRYSPRAYKLGLFACSLLAVVLLPVGARAAGLSPGESAATAALGTVVFWACFPAMLWRTGLFSFVTASAALGTVLGVLLRFDRRPTFGRWAVLAGSGAALVFAHVTAPIMLVGPAIGYLAATAWRWRSRRGRLGAVTLAVAVALAVNLVWLVPLLRFRGIRAPAAYFMTTNSARFLWDFMRHNPLDGRVAFALLVVGVAGLGAWWWEGARCRAAVFGGAATVLLALCWLGGLWSVTRTTEPFRFLATLDLVLTVPAGSFLVRAAQRTSRLVGGGVRGGAFTGVVAAAALGAAWFASPETVPLVVQMANQYRPLVVGLRPEDGQLVRMLRDETDLSARVLFEDQLRLLEMTDPESTHWTPLLPLLLQPEGRAFIGGLYHMAFITHHRAASFGDYALGGRRVDAWPPNELNDYCRRYNVGWVVCWSPLSQFWFDMHPDARHVATLPRPATPGREVMPNEAQWRAIAKRAGVDVANRYMAEGVNHYRVYRVERPHSYFLEGSGRVAAFDYNRVELADVNPDPQTGSVVLSLHWLDTWKSDPPLPLTPVSVPGDPVPFVRLQTTRPLPRVILSNGY